MKCSQVIHCYMRGKDKIRHLNECFSVMLYSGASYYQVQYKDNRRTIFFEDSVSSYANELFRVNERGTLKQIFISRKEYDEM